MFSDVIYRYLKTHYANDFHVNPSYCIAVDVFNCNEVRYQDILDGQIPVLIDKTIEDINNIQE